MYGVRNLGVFPVHFEYCYIASVFVHRWSIFRQTFEIVSCVFSGVQSVFSVHNVHFVFHRRSPSVQYLCLSLGLLPESEFLELCVVSFDLSNVYFRNCVYSLQDSCSSFFYNVCV